MVKSQSFNELVNSQSFMGESQPNVVPEKNEQTFSESYEKKQ